MVLSRKSIEYIKKNKRQTQIRVLHKSLGERGEEENQDKGEPVESCNHQSKVRVGLIFSNLRLCNSETEFSM